MSDKRIVVKALIQEVMGIDIDKIDNDKDLSKIDEWDSFNNLMLISKIEDRFKVKFTVKDIEEVNSINKVIALVDRK